MAPNTSPQPALSWTIVGQGAIGLLAACRLSLAGNAVSLWLKTPNIINIDFTEQQFSYPPAIAPLNAVLVPVKSYAILDAIKGLLPHLSPDAQLVLSHNGMGTIAQVKPLLLPTQGLWFLTTTHGALKQHHNLFHTGQGQSVIAPLNSAAIACSEAVTQVMDIALGPITLTDNIAPYLWQKLAINAVINPLTAIYDCQNGQLSAAEYRSQIAEILAEVCQLATLMGISLVYEDTLAKVQQVIIQTAKNYSSMHQDVKHQRRTEIAAINGFVVEQAARFQLAVPQNAVLLQRVIQLEQAYGR